MIIPMLRRGILQTLISLRGDLKCLSTSSAVSPVSGRKVVASGALADVEADDIIPDQALAATAAKVETLSNLLQPGVVVYDGVCHLCHRGMKWVIKADRNKNLKFCCLQSKAAEPYISVAGLDREDVLRRFLFVEGPGLYHQGSAAALKVLSYLPFPYSSLSTLMIIPTPLRDAVYDYVAKRRYDWFGRDDQCLVLKDQELLSRFIDREELLDRSKQKL